MNSAFNFLMKNGIKSFVLYYLSGFITKVIRFLNRIDKKISNYVYKPTKSEFLDLSPKSDSNNKHYLEALYWAIRNKRIRNIGLTGPLGSGKSSIIKTFESNYKEFNILNISVAPYGNN